MSKLMNDASGFVDESLSGIIKAYSEQLRFVKEDHRAIVRANAPAAGKVAIVTGGGYGHLPVFLGYVGEGLCDGVAVGNVFTSPSCEAITDAAKAVNGGNGILFLFGNYMGDTMNFEMAGEILGMEEIPTEIVKGSDDIASGSREAYLERRGVGGIFFLYKIAGAKADEMASLGEVAAAARMAGQNIATLGFAMSSCQLPGAPHPIFEIDDDDMELGMGIHGEPGIERVKTMSSKELACYTTEKLLRDLDVQDGEEVAMLVNGLGATSREELFLFYNDIHTCFLERNVKIAKVYVGEYATSLEMKGGSVSILKLNDERKRLLEKPACSPFVRY